jgi:hypothetical protein
MRHALAVAGLAVAVLSAGCGGTSPPRSSAVASQPAGPTAGPAAAAARAAIEQALGARSVQLEEPQVSYRPGEAAAVATAPRRVLRAILPDDPTHGFIVVYELPTEAAATSAAEAQAAYVASAVGRVQFPFGTQFVVRRLGRAVIFYADPADSPDDQASDVAEALRTVGTEVVVPS